MNVIYGLYCGCADCETARRYEMAKKYGVSYQVISLVITGKTWL